MLKRRIAVPALALCFVQFARAADATAVAEYIRNFGEVNDHLYRGGQPTQRGLEELAARHVDLVIDLRETSADTKLEQEMVEALKMKFLNIPLHAYGAPSNEEMQRVLWLLVNGDSKHIFVHCWRGKDRTGTVVACYRIQHDGWENRKALEEAHKYRHERHRAGHALLYSALFTAEFVGSWTCRAVIFRRSFH